MKGMRSRVLLALLGSLAGCTLFVDTGGFGGAGQTSEMDASGDASTSGMDGAGDVIVTNGDAGETGDAADAGDAGQPPELVGHWTFDEGSGSTTMDVSGHGHHGIVFGGTWVEDRHGVAGRALFLNGRYDAGGGDYVSVSAHPDFDRPANAKLTVTAWVRFDAPPGHENIITFEYGGGGAYDLEFWDATTLTYFDGREHVALGTTPNVVGAWHHLGVVVDGAEARTYFDGVRIGQSAADTTPRVAKRIQIGADRTGDSYTRIALDEVRVYRGALDDAQLLADKNR